MPTATPDELDALYAANPDPWNFRDSPYETSKYDLTLEMLPRAHYGDILEVGCSIAVLGRRLASRCDRYLGIDASTRALDLARREATASMRLRWMLVPGEFPEGPFDLIVLSEILYFLDAHDVARLARRSASAAPAGDILSVNTFHPTDRELGGDEAAEIFIRAMGRLPDLTHTTPDFRVDVFRAPPTEARHSQ